MNRSLLRLGLLGAAILGLTTIVSATAGATSPQISGTAVFDTTGECPIIDAYNSYPPLVMSGDLEGCWYTRIDESKYLGSPSGVYLESGKELFIGIMNGLAGQLTTTYRFEAKLDPATGSEVRGRCQHPIAEGSGTGGFSGVSGRVDFKDIIGAEITYVYRGHISVP
jgi:hypothetical protein